jgi:hypothetical protein
MYLIARFRVEDFDRWKHVFDELEDVRVKHGGRGHRILRVLDEPDEYLVMCEFASAGGAEGFRWEPALLRAIDAGGVEGGAHHVQYTLDRCEELEASTYRP